MATGKELIENVPVGGTILSMEHITKIYDNGFVANNDVSFDVKKGEILGLSGLVGAGRSELFECLMGMRPEHTGEVRYQEKPMMLRPPVFLSIIIIGPRNAPTAL